MPHALANFDLLPNLRWSGRAVNKLPVVMLRRAAQLLR
jgi:hypothetical protein